MISYAGASPTLRVSPSPISEQTVQDCLTEKYTRIFTEPFELPRHGTRVAVPEFASLVKHLREGDNKLPRTLAKLTMGYRRLEVGKPMLCGMFHKAAAVAASQYPVEASISIEELSALETQLQGDIDRLQVKLWQRDFSCRTLKDFLDSLYRMRNALDRMIEWAEKKLYGSVQ